MNTHHDWLGISNRECLIKSDTPHVPHRWVRSVATVTAGWSRSYPRPPAIIVVTASIMTWPG